MAETAEIAQTAQTDDETLPVCNPGLQGLPIQVTGWAGFQDRNSLIVPNDIHIQLAPKGQPLSSTTFFVNGTQYFIAEYRFSKPKQEDIKNFSKEPFAELHFWGKPSATALNKDTIALFCIPVYESYKKSNSQEKYEQSSFPLDLLPEGDTVQIIKYSTCVENKKGSTNINVCYWSTGLAVDAGFYKSIANQIGEYGVPKSVLDDQLLLSSYEQYADERKTKGRRVYKELTTLSVPYFSSVLLSTASPEFQKGFRLIKGFKIQQVNSAGNDINNFKCIRINRQKDIKDGRLLIDPKTGKSLREENDDADAEVNASLQTDTDQNSKSTFIFVLVIVGIIVGLCGLALLIYVIQLLFSTREVANLPAITKDTLAAAAKSGNVITK